MPNFDNPMQSETLGDYLECRLAAINMAIQAMQRQTDTIMAAHNTVVDRLDRMYKNTRPELHERLYCFADAMQAFADEKEVKRLRWNRWYSAQRCDCIPLYADGVNANDWQIKS